MQTSERLHRDECPPGCGKHDLLHSGGRFALVERMATATRPRYPKLLLALLRRLLKQHPGLSRDDFDEAFRTARAAAGGHAKAERRESGQTSLADDASEDSFEELIQEVQDALQSAFGSDCWTVATYADHVVYYRGNQTQPDADDDPDDRLSPFDDAWEEAVEGTPDGDNDADDVDIFYLVKYERDSNDQITFGEQQVVEKNITWQPDGEGDDSEDSYEESIDELEEALYRMYGDRCRIIASYPDRVIYCLGGANGAEQHWEQEYSEDENTEQLTFGDKQAVSMNVSWEPVNAEAGVSLVYAKAGASGSTAGGKTKLPANVAKLPANLQKQWVDVFNQAMKHCGKQTPACEKIAFRMANGVLKKHKGKVAAEGGWGEPSGAVALAASFSDKPWKAPTVAQFGGSVDKYCSACLIDLNEPGEERTAQNCKLPYKEPGGAINKGALRAIAAVLGGARGGVKGVPPAVLAKAKKKHAALMKQAGIGNDVQAESLDAQLVLYDGTRTLALPRRLQAVDWSKRGFNSVALRLDDATEHRIPVWQQLHKIGSWVVPHASGQKIQLTRDMGNTMIRNFQRQVVRRAIPMDYRHFTDQGGEALAWLEEVRWGSEGQGLPDGPEPDGIGKILYGRFDYNDIGLTAIKQRRYKYISPQYHLNYCDSESGQCYGPTMMAVAATNNPYLRVRDLQGNAAPEPVTILEDGLVGTMERDDMVDQVKLEELQTRLEAAEQALLEERRQRHIATVETYLREEMHKGLPPALARLARPILLNSAPDAEAIISLSEESSEPTHNLHEATKALIAEIPRMPVGVTLTHSEDVRPHDPGKAMALDEQVIPEYVKGLFHLAGLDGPNRDSVLMSTAKADGDA